MYFVRAEGGRGESRTQREREGVTERGVSEGEAVLWFLVGPGQLGCNFRYT